MQNNLQNRLKMPLQQAERLRWRTEVTKDIHSHGFNSRRRRRKERR